MKWTDSLDIAIDLIDKFPEIDPTTIRFTELRAWVLDLENFNDEPERCGEKILEAIQMYWIEEMD
ncbi:MAG: Fe-S cluster assembly protein IscX [Gammaproteobacteria bacterium]|nr:Fe-S cluster assembly protein IscX [Gammaproteobacteria bacterium]